MQHYKFATRPIAHAEAVVAGPNYRFTVLTDGLLRYEWAEDGNFEDRASTFVINRDLPVPEFRVNDQGDVLELSTERFHLTYDKKRPSPSGFVVDGKSKVTQHSPQWRYGDLDRSLGGTARTLDDVEGRIDLEPGVITRRGLTAIDDSDSMLFDGKGWVGGRRPGDRVDGYLFAYALDHREAIKAFYAISGSQPHIPRWALGNWWSRYYAYTQDGYVELMDRFTEERIPLCVAVIDMDWHLVSDDRVSHAGWTGYTWNKDLFPDPQAFGRELHQRNLKITLNDHPADGIHAFEDLYEEMAKAVGHDTSFKDPILFDPTNPKFMDAFNTMLHRSIEKQACDFWWIDWQQGRYSRVPGIDPLWMLNHFQFLDIEQVTSHPLIFSRYAGPGSHRYPVGFSGDTVNSWASLEFQPEFTATSSNIGYGWWSHDIGGHMKGGRNDECVTRWVQLGVFSPILRLHSSESQWMSKEPWTYRKECQVIMTASLQLRHRLLPYLYTMNFRSSQNDEPLVQPMYWSYPYEKEAYNVPNQYTFGSELIVAPITKPRDLKTNLARVKAWLPPGGRLVDIFTGTVYDGGRALNLYRPLDEYPVLAPEGSIIPLDASLTPSNGGLNPEAFEILVVVGKDRKFDIREDVADDRPGTKTNPSEGKERTFPIRYDQEEGKLTVTTTARSWTFRFISLTSIPLEDLKVLIDDKPRSDLDVEVEMMQSPRIPGLVVKVPALSETKYELSVLLGPDPQIRAGSFLQRLHRMLLDYQVNFALKDRIWATASAEKVLVALKVGQLMTLSIDDPLLGPVLELLLADSRAN